VDGEGTKGRKQQGKKELCVHKKIGFTVHA
jgi:hypothetical protein